MEENGCVRRGETATQEIRTRGTPVKHDLVAVATTIASGEVKWHVHVAHKMNQELERILNVVWDGLRLDARPAKSLELLQHVGGIPDGAQDVNVRPAFPALWTWERARRAGIVVHGADIVKRGGPSILSLPTGVVRPCCNRREVTLPGDAEDVAEFRHHTRVQVHLRDGRDDFMT